MEKYPHAYCDQRSQYAIEYKVEQANFCWNKVYKIICKVEKILKLKKKQVVWVLWAVVLSYEFDFVTDRTPVLDFLGRGRLQVDSSFKWVTGTIYMLKKFCEYYFYRNFIYTLYTLLFLFKILRNYLLYSALAASILLMESCGTWNTYQCHRVIIHLVNELYVYVTGIRQNHNERIRLIHASFI